MFDRLVSAIGDTYGAALLLHMLTSTICLTLLAYQATKIDGVNVYALSTIGYLVYALGQVFHFCIFGNRLIEEVILFIFRFCVIVILLIHFETAFNSYRVHRSWKLLIVAIGMMVRKRQRHSFRLCASNVKKPWPFLVPNSSPSAWICSLRYVISLKKQFETHVKCTCIKFSFWFRITKIGARCRCNLLHGVGATQVREQKLQSNTQGTMPKDTHDTSMDTVPNSTWSFESTGSYTVYYDRIQWKFDTFYTSKLRIWIHTEIMKQHKQIALTQYKHSKRYIIIMDHVCAALV